jgi:hypothetical protein
MKNLLTVKEVRPELPFRINYGMGDISLRRNEKNDFDFDVYLPSKGINLQRPLVWTEFQKEQLVYSIFKGLKLPNISVLKHFPTDAHRERRDYIYQVIDGKQRLTTLISFIDNEFSVDWKGKLYFFDDLHPYLQSDFYESITSNIGFDYPNERVSDDAKIAWFEMINFAGTPQDIEHLKKLKK